MSGLALNCINSAENEFFAEQSLITIIPGVDQPQLQFVSGKFGPLTGGFPAVVPLWLAVTLRKRGKCTIQIPDWMTVAALEQRVQLERTQGTLSDLPFHYMEIAQLLLASATDDIASAGHVAVLLQDIENIRMDRIRLGVMGVAETVSRNNAVPFANLNNASSMEILTMKRFFLSSMDAFHKFCPSADAAEGTDNDYADSGAAGTGSGGRRLRRFRNK
jgi:GINS complex subunit 2